MTVRTHLRWVKTLLIGVVTASGPDWIAHQAAALPMAQMGPSPGGMGMGMARWQSDQHFVEMMIPHHDGAIAMAELARTRSKRPQIRMLAERIQRSQSAENAQMRRWYRQWFNADVPRWPAGAAGFGHGMGMGWHSGMGGGMPGMGISLEALKNAADFDRTFVEQMIPHHRMGVMMASHASWNTQHRELRDLQAAMVKVQSQEIAQMEQWYSQWYGALRL
jgi:uncharacterized protein (DUF305 family)